MIQVKSTDKLIFDLEMLQVDYNEEKIISLRQKIADKYNVPLKNVEINFKPITHNKDGERLSLTSDIINNIQDPKFQIQLFKEYIDLKEYNDVDFEFIENIDAQVNNFVDFNAYSKYKNYRFKYVKWDNYLSYGKGNYFDFTTLKGLVALKGEPENQCGKTTFAIDLLRFALFGKAQKSPTLDSVFNAYLPEETEVVVELGIEIQGVDYVIKRTITRPTLKKRTSKSKAKQTVEYYKVINDNLELIENCEGESATQTNNIIKETVGSVDDFSLVISATAYSLGDILRMGQSDKGKLFSRWLGLLSIEEKENIAKDIWKKQINPKLLSNTYNRSTLENEIEDFKECINKNNELIISCEKNKEIAQQHIIEAKEEQVNLLQTKKEVKEDLIKTDITTIDNNINKYNDDLLIKRGQMSQMKKEYLEIKDVVFNQDVVDELTFKIKTYNCEINSLNETNAEIRTSIKHLREEKIRINELIEKEVCPHCKQKVSIDEQNKFIEEISEKEKLLTKKGVENKKKIDEYVETINKINLEIEKLNTNKEIVFNRQKLELKMTAVKENIENIKLQLQMLLKTKEEIEISKENIKINNEIDIKFRNLDILIKTETNIKENEIKNIQNLQNNNNHYQKEIDSRLNLITKLKDEEKIVFHWKLYQELVGKNGIVKIILKKALPAINNEISRILNGLCDFNVILSISDDNKVCIDLYRDGQKMDLGTCSSGFEGTFAALAIRSALASIGNIASPSMMCLDEVDATIAAPNYDNLTELYRRILSNYQFIIHIAHNELLEHIHDMTIMVYKEDNVSKISLK